MLEGRRLTGANFLCNKPAAIIDTEIPKNNFNQFYECWQRGIYALHQSLEFAKPDVGARRHAKGQSLFVTAPIDALYSTITMCELCYDAISIDKPVAIEQRALMAIANSLKPQFEAESRPDILAIQALATKNDVPFLWDDDYLSLGYGQYAETWSIANLPNLNDINWTQYQPIPLAIITGTNGKSTTTRLAAHICRCAGFTPGFSSTDGIWAGNDCLDDGDYSGPGGAREVLRNNHVDIAILEVARGGLLRRGLGSERAQVALITNVAEDHLGEYGVNTLSELIKTKFIVSKALYSDTGVLILNADDQGCVEYAKQVKNTIIWCSVDANNSTIAEHQANGGTTFTLVGEYIQLYQAEQMREFAKVSDIPITLNGTAKHNIANAIAASALCWSLDIPLVKITNALISFDGNTQNPGRGNIFKIKHATIMVDFAHNPHGLNAVVDTLVQQPASRRLVMLGHAGDRSDADIEALTNAALKFAPDQIIIYEVEDYLRGRKLGEIPSLVHQTLAKCNFDQKNVLVCKDAIEGTQVALNWSLKNHESTEDLLLLLTLSKRNEVVELLKLASK